MVFINNRGQVLIPKSSFLISLKKRQIFENPKQSEISWYSFILIEFRLFWDSRIRIVGNSFLVGKQSENRLKILNLNLLIIYSEFSIQISNPLVIYFKPS